jgi:hypothetical protein
VHLKHFGDFAPFRDEASEQTFLCALHQTAERKDMRKKALDSVVFVFCLQSSRLFLFSADSIKIEIILRLTRGVVSIDTLYGSSLYDFAPIFFAHWQVPVTNKSEKRILRLA